MVFLIVGAAFVLLALLLFFLAERRRAEGHRLLSTANLTCGEIGRLSGDNIARRVECAAQAQPGPAGPVTTPLSLQPSVWYRYKVDEEYWDWETRRDSDGRERRERVRKTRTVTNESSDNVFSLADASGSVLVDPKGATVDRPRKVRDEYQPAGARFPDSVAGFLGQLIGGLGSRDVIGYKHEEWAILPGEHLFVVGEATARSGPVVIAKGADRMVVSTRSEEEYARSRERSAKGMAWAAGIALLLGIAGVATGLIVLLA